MGDERSRVESGFCSSISRTHMQHTNTERPSSLIKLGARVSIASIMHLERVSN